MLFSRSRSWKSAIYHLKRHQLVEVTSVKGLGVLIVNKLNFLNMLIK